MTEDNAEHQLDLLELIGQDKRNQAVEHGDFTLTIVRGILTSRGMIVPTLAEIAASVTQTTSLTPALELPTARKQDPKVTAVGSELVLADLKTPDHFRQYFVYKLGMFLGQEVSLSLPSQAHVDRGQRIKDAGLTTFEPVVFPNLTIKQGFQYPANWRFPLDPWIYQQITEGNLKPADLKMQETWGWLDTSERLDWKSGDPMFDPKTDQVLVKLSSGLRAKGKKDGIEVTQYTRHLNSGSLYGVSAVEAKQKVYPAIAKMIPGVRTQEVVDLTVVQLNFIGNWLYPHFGEKNSWEWLRNNFGADYLLLGGYRDHGGLGYVYFCPVDHHHVDIRFRPLVVSPSVA